MSAERIDVLAVWDDIAAAANGRKDHDTNADREADAARAELAELIADAARWRFLRLRLFRSDVAETIFDYPADTKFSPTSYGEASEIDDLIDAALARIGGSP